MDRLVVVDGVVEDGTLLVKLIAKVTVYNRGMSCDDCGTTGIGRDVNGLPTTSKGRRHIECYL